MSKWKTKELRNAPSPQPWKLDIQGQLDLFDEFAVQDDPTQEHFITEPDDYMQELSFENEDTGVYEGGNDV